MISLVDRQTGNIVRELPDPMNPEGEQDTITKIVAVLNGNRLVAAGDALYVLDMQNGRILHQRDLDPDSELQLLPNGNIFIKCEMMDNWSYFASCTLFNTTTYQSAGVACNESVLDHQFHGRYLACWYSKETNYEEEADYFAEDSEDGQQEVYQKATVKVFDTSDCALVFNMDLEYGRPLVMRYDEEGVDDYNGWSPQVLSPPIAGIHFGQLWLAIWNAHCFQLYDSKSGRRVCTHNLQGIRGIWSAEDNSLAIHASDRVLEFNINSQKVVSETSFAALPAERPDLFLSHLENSSPYSRINNSALSAEVGKVAVWVNAFEDSRPLEWLTAYRPTSCRFTSNHEILAESVEPERSDILEVWFGNEKVSLVQAAAKQRL
jgi:hypothetical protein